VVADDDRVRELARMLAGLEGSESAAAHAQELLDLAASDRAAADIMATTAVSTATVRTPRRRKARP
jgi:DNA repair protein RecN (Recombination protein N)